MKTTKLTAPLLHEYSVAALANAGQLLSEAAVLYENGHFARAYFLAVASIEETGKAFLAFDGQGRNVTDPTVATKLLGAMEDHQTKITSAFAAWLIASPNKQDSLKPAIDLMIHLRRGREPSMYTDINQEASTVQVPARVVRDKAACDCIRLARNCLAHSQSHVAERKPEVRSKAEDKLFAMKKGQFQKIANAEDFWWYYLGQIEAGGADLASAVVSYHETFVRTGTLYGRRPEGGGSDA
jgi:AbiV family abortive infection protein